MKTGILLVNLGTPKSSKPKDVRNYLIEFLTDGRVIDLPYLRRQLLVRNLIVPSRYRQSAKLYEEIWTEDGSPLLVYGREVERALQKELGEAFCVKLAMRYQEPSIKEGLLDLKKEGMKRLIVLPLFPQYASATTGSVHQKVLEEIKMWRVIPEMHLIHHFFDHPRVIEAFCDRIQEVDYKAYDHILFSYHGLPLSHVLKENQDGSCYATQCTQMTELLADRLGLENYSRAYQSRLGKEPWLQPYVSDALDALLKEGKKKILVCAPSFVCDCLETIQEIGIEYADAFVKNGGEKLDLVEGLNCHPTWITGIKEVVEPYLFSKTR